MDVTGSTESKYVDDESTGVSWFGLIIYVSHRHLDLVIVSREGGSQACSRSLHCT